MGCSGRLTADANIDRPDALLDTGEIDGAATWWKIVNSIGVMQVTEAK